MPGNINLASARDVLPAWLCKEFVRTETFCVLRNSYSDGTVQWLPMHAEAVSTDEPRSVEMWVPFGVEPRRSWRLKRRMPAAELVALREFLLAHPVEEFLFYDPTEPADGQSIGSNWDETGESLQGRYTVRLQGDISQEMGMALGDMPLALVELAQGFGDGTADFSTDGNALAGVI